MFQSTSYADNAPFGRFTIELKQAQAGAHIGEVAHSGAFSRSGEPAPLFVPRETSLFIVWGSAHSDESEKFGEHCRDVSKISHRLQIFGPALSDAQTLECAFPWHDTSSEHA